MKKYSLLVFSLSAMTLVVSSLFFSSCKKDDESAKDKNQKILTSGKWTMTDVFVDGVNRNDLFTGLTLTVSKGTYTTENGEPVWPTSGTWAFVDSKANTLLRDDGTVVSILTLTKTNLKLSLQWNETTLGNGKKSSVKGEHIFEFSR